MSVAEAVKAGRRAKMAAETRKKNKAIKEADKEKKALRIEVRRVKKYLLESGIIFKRITKAVKEGDTKLELCFPNYHDKPIKLKSGGTFFLEGRKALAVAINELARTNKDYKGLEATHSHGSDYINSDEVKEDWENVTVHWQDEEEDWPDISLDGDEWPELGYTRKKRKS